MKLELVSPSMDDPLAMPRKQHLHGCAVCPPAYFFSLRTMPPPRVDPSPAFYPGLGQEGTCQQQSQQRQPRGGAAVSSREHLESGGATHFASDGTGGDASSLAQPPQDGGDNGSDVGGEACTSKGVYDG